MTGKKWRRFRPTLYGGMVLIVLLVGIVYLNVKEDNPLLKKNNAMTLYLEVEAGEKPEFRTEDFFPDGEVDPEKVSYEIKDCDFTKPGVQMVPVFYDGEETNCQVKVTVIDPDQKQKVLKSTQEMKPAH